jgi:hypothetical protein
MARCSFVLETGGGFLDVGESGSLPFQTVGEEMEGEVSKENVCSFTTLRKGRRLLALNSPGHGL